MKKHIRYVVPVILLAAPLVTFASTQTLGDIIMLLIGYLNKILALLMGVAVVCFVWYIIRYFIMEHDKRTEAGKYLMWSIIGFFVIFSMWGLVNILISTFNLGNTSPGTWSSLSNIFPK